MAKVKRVLVGAKTFATPLVPGQIIQRGETVTVDSEVAENLDTHHWMDKASNEQPLFVETSDRLAKPFVEAKEEAPAKPARTKRATRKKKEA